MPSESNSFSNSVNRGFGVVISNLKLKGIVGVYPKERKKKQRLDCSITLFLDLNPLSFTSTSESLKETIDYALLAADIRALFLKTKPYLLEGFAADLTRFLFRQTKIKAVLIKLKKLTAIKNARFGAVYWYQEKKNKEKKTT